MRGKAHLWYYFLGTVTREPNLIGGRGGVGQCHTFGSFQGLDWREQLLAGIGNSFVP